RFQDLDGAHYTDSQYGGNINFNHASRFFGFLTFSVGSSDTANAMGNNGAALNTVVSANKRVGHWETSADFTYAQNVMTIGSVSTTRNYRYGACVRRKVNGSSHSEVLIAPPEADWRWKPEMEIPRTPSPVSCSGGSTTSEEVTPSRTALRF